VFRCEDVFTTEVERGGAATKKDAERGTDFTAEAAESAEL